MGTEPGKPSLVSRTRHDHQPRNFRIHALDKLRKSYDRSRTSVDQVEMTEKDLPKDSTKMLDLNHYLIIDEVWHYSSVDMGKKCKSSIREDLIHLLTLYFRSCLHWIQFNIQ
jgi:hypothetical protein